MCNISSGRSEPCYNNIGGLLNIYLFTYVPYRKYEIEVNEGKLISYPSTDVYRYELRADANTFNSDLEEQPDGISYNQTANFILKGLRSDAVEINGLLNKRIGCIVETRLGHYQIMGLYNGVKVKSVKGDTGSSRDSFSGYNISLEAKEISQPFFIDDLEDAGFNIIAPLVPFYLLQENGFKLLQENASGILLDPPAPLQLVADYQFNNNLIDSVGGNNGTGTNISYNVGDNGNEAVFNGSSSFVEIPDNDAFTFTDGVNDLPFRMELVVKMNNSSNTQQIINKRNPSNNSEYMLQFGANQFYFILLTQNAQQVIQKRCDFVQSSDDYYNIILKYDGTKSVDGMSINVNGLEGDFTFGTTYNGMTNTNAPIILGRRGWQSSNFLNGAISQIKVYK